MNKISIVSWILRGILLTSLIVFVISVKNIWFADSKVNEALEEWNTNDASLTQWRHEISIDELQVETLIADGNFSPETNVPHSKTDTDMSTESITLNKGDIIGKITIPRLNRELPIIHGTHKEALNRGIGHYIGSVLPGMEDNSVLAGHRDTVFKDLGKLEIGDQVVVETMSGKYIYEIQNFRIVDSDDRTVIVPYDEAVLTLVTCYPFNFVGPAPQRYILTATLVD